MTGPTTFTKQATTQAKSFCKNYVSMSRCAAKFVSHALSACCYASQFGGCATTFLRVLVVAAVCFSVIGAVVQLKRLWKGLKLFDWNSVSKSTHLDLMAETFTCVMALGVVVTALSYIFYLPPLMFVILILWSISCLSLMLEGKIKFCSWFPPGWLSATFVILLGVVAFRDIVYLID